MVGIANTLVNFAISKAASLAIIAIAAYDFKSVLIALRNVASNCALLFFTILFVFRDYINYDSLGSVVYWSFITNVFCFLSLYSFAVRMPNILERGGLWFARVGIFLSWLMVFGLGEASNYVELAGRLTIFGINQNKLGVLFAVSLLYLYRAMLSGTIIKSVGAIVGVCNLIALIIGLLYTGSRVAIIGALLGVIVLDFSDGSGRSAGKKAFGRLVGLLLIGAFASLKLGEVLIGRLSATINEGDLSGREEIWRGVLEITKDNWFLGVGQTGYASRILTAMVIPITVDEIEVPSPHNVVLEVICYTGIVGGVLFFCFLIPPIINAYRSANYHKDGIRLALLMPILGIIGTGQIFNQKYVWAILAVCCAEVPTVRKTLTKAERHKSDG
jgi:O-antigen ligase